MILGFTGTRKGLSLQQLKSLQEFLQLLDGIKEVHHGDCIGGDEQFHGLAIAHHVPSVVIHPGYNDRGESPSRSFCNEHSPGEGHSLISVLPAGPYLLRDKDIVNSSQLLIGCPLTHQEQIRSGTWTTIRYARKINRAHIIIYPDGHPEEFGK